MISVYASVDVLDDVILYYDFFSLLALDLLLPAKST
jgi:hypothetical protein